MKSRILHKAVREYIGIPRYQNKKIAFNNIDRINHGFNFRQLYVDYKFVADLNDYFTAWQKCNYKEELFPHGAGIQNVSYLKLSLTMLQMLISHLK